METITFHCRTVTPLVMNGAYRNNALELRPPGIKASLRFWWRALHGYLPLEDIKDRSGNVITKGLRSKESEIFGSTKGRSKVIIRIEENINNQYNEKTYLLPHKTESERVKSPVAAFAPNLLFKIRIDFDENVISSDKMKNIFILSSVLGGWGKRSRRGFGSVKVTAVNQQPYQSPSCIDEIYELLDKTYFIKTNNIISSDFRRSEGYPFLKSIELSNRSFRNIDDILLILSSVTRGEKDGEYLSCGDQSYKICTLR